MAFSINILRPTSSRLDSSNHARDYDSASTDSEDTARSNSRSRASYTASTSATAPMGSPRSTVFLFPQNRPSGRSSLSSTASSTPLPSRSNSPLPQYYHGHAHPHQSSSCPSDTDSESHSPLLRGTGSRYPWWREHQRTWWSLSRRRRKRNGRYIRTLRKWIRRIARLPFFPGQPITVVLTLILLSIFAIFLTLLLVYILNPDKEPLPWKAYCAAPSLAASYDPPYPSQNLYPDMSSTKTVVPFPPPNLDSLPPAGMFVGVFSIDSAFERRMLVRTTWASHPRSRDGAAGGDDGRGTSRTVVRFILGQPRKDWERRVKLEMEMYNDIVILPIPENMNSGKTHSFFSWASLNAWVPPLYKPSELPLPQFSYSNYTSSPPALAPHDPFSAWENIHSGKIRSWVRPDYVVKVDDDAFVMLAELESRLRVELYNQKTRSTNSTGHYRRNAPISPLNTSSAVTSTLSSIVPAYEEGELLADDDPLVYWGYLVTNRLHQFMAGELYALSWSLVDWVAKDPTVKTLTRGAEDKQTSKWMRLHPRADDVKWASERCWIYDHPRSGTVYAHGFLFPSEVTRIKRAVMGYFERFTEPVLGNNPTSTLGSSRHAIPAAWSHSSVSTFGVRYTPPLPDLSTQHSVEALVEGSDMSMLREGSPMTPEHAWIHREGRKARYQNQRVGGTVVVHFIKKNMWYLETALALLEGDDVSEAEKYESQKSSEDYYWSRWSHNFQRQHKLRG